MGKAANNADRITKNQGLRLPVLLFVLCYSLSPQAQQVFRSGIDLTTLAITATDKKGNIVTDLTRDDFEVFEDGKKQTAQYFALGDGDAAPPMHLGLMIDASSSMQNELKLAQGAAIKFLN